MKAHRFRWAFSRGRTTLHTKTADTVQGMPLTTKSRGSKNAHDKFYTKPDVAAACLAALDLSHFSRIIEPSARGGAFSDILFATRPNQVLALDLAPESSKVEQQDWFPLCERSSGRTLAPVSASRHHGFQQLQAH